MISKSFLFGLNPQLFSSLVAAVNLSTAVNGIAWIILTFGLVASVGGLLWATIQGMQERTLASVGHGLICAAVGGLALVIATAMFQAGGLNISITPTQLN
jgi:hypothetical protein